MSSAVPQDRDQALHDCLVALANRPDGDPGIASDLVRIAALSADLIDGVAYASVTNRQAGAYATVAASSELAVEIDRAQYADDAGPCLDALDGEYPAAVPDIAATMTWPGFREAALRLGLKASLSVPLVAGRGITVAALNLYSRDGSALKLLSHAVWTVFEDDEPSPPRAGELDPGGHALVVGLIGAFAAQASIQRAVGLLMATTGKTADEAFEDLWRRAAEAGAPPSDVADRLLDEHRR